MLSIGLFTIKCQDVQAILNELAVYVADQAEAVPTLKSSEFVLSPIDDEALDKNLVVTAIREYLDSIGEGHSFEVVPAKNTIFIKSVTGKVMEKKSRQDRGMFSCSHCGFMTQYEEEYHIHMRIHYL